MDTISLEQNPMLSDVVIARPEDLTNTRCPTVALHLLVKNGESCVGRLLDNVGPYIHEVVAVVNDTTDQTMQVLFDKSKQHDLALQIVVVTAETHPGFYLNDVPETYQVGVPLAGEVYEGPFTGKPLLASWAAVRNLGWKLGRSEWKLFLDADDVVEDPESIPGLCLALEERGIDLATSRYQFGTTASGKSQQDGFRERLVRDSERIWWYGRVHEALAGQERTAHIEGSLRVIDWRDSTGAELRAPGRAFKVLYAEARSKGWEVAARTFLYLAIEAKKTMPRFAEAALDRYMAKSTWKEERAWALTMRGEICEADGNFEAASTWYMLSIMEHPGSKTAFRLCHTLFREEKWAEAIAAYHRGVANKATLQVLDSGAVYEDASKILVAAALRKLGRFIEAMEFCEAALSVFPSNLALANLRKLLARDMSRGVGGDTADFTARETKG